MLAYGIAEEEKKTMQNKQQFLHISRYRSIYAERKQKRS